MIKKVNFNAREVDIIYDALIEQEENIEEFLKKFKKDKASKDQLKLVKKLIRKIDKQIYD